MSTEHLTLGILVGSNRPQRAGRDMADAVAALVQKHGDVTVRMLDLREIQLPWFDELRPPSVGDYQHDHTKEWARTIDGLDAVVVVTSQYNGGYPAPLKNAIDTVYGEWRDKPVLLVSYGGRGSGGGRSAVEQLRTVFGVTRSNVLEGSVSMQISAEDYAEPGATLKDASVVVDRHRRELEEQITLLIDTARA